MAKPLPAPVNQKVRTSISLPARTIVAAEEYRRIYPKENLHNFSAILGAALTEYLTKHHPGLIERCIEDISKHRPKLKSMGDVDAWLDSLYDPASGRLFEASVKATPSPDPSRKQGPQYVRKLTPTEQGKRETR